MMLKLFYQIPQSIRYMSAVLLASATLLVATILLTTSLRDTKADAYPLDKSCYSVFDQSGREYKSWFAPMYDNSGNASFTSDQTTGYVFKPAAIEIDRDCLRERYSDDPDFVPPLEGVD